MRPNPHISQVTADELLARIGLRAAARYGFVLAGGYAVQAHGFLTRRSEDVDLFTSTDAQDNFSAAAAELWSKAVDEPLA
jgi:hypothetical protein